MASIKNKKFGKLIPIDLVKKSSKGKMWNCYCTCGKEGVLEENFLKKNQDKAECLLCGESLVKKERKKLDLLKKKVYSLWNNTKNRCKKEGIGIEKSWYNFETFLFDVGEPASPDYRFTRIDKNKGFYKDNCKWERVYQNQEESVYHYKDDYMTVRELCKKYDKNYRIVQIRLGKGTPIDLAMR
jgi:hypothetical protein